MNPSKKPARIWNWSDSGTRWSSRVSSSSARTPFSSSAPRRDPAYAGLDPTSIIPSSTGSADGKPEADSDYDDSSSRYHYPLPTHPPESTISLYEEGVAQGSRSTDHRVTPSVRHPDTKTSSSLSPVPTSSSSSCSSSSSSTPTPVPTPVPKPMPIAKHNHARRPQRAAVPDAKSDETRALLRKHLAEMQKTHAYIVKSALTAARLDLNSRKPPAKVVYDRVSPFKDMKSIEITSAEAKERKCDVGKFAVKYHGKGVENKFLVPAAISVTPEGLAQMPKYHSYTTLRNNILADDDEVMRYFPYFGEDAEEEEINQLNLEETFVDRTKASAEDGRRSECELLPPFPYFSGTDLTTTANRRSYVHDLPPPFPRRPTTLPFSRH